MVDYSKYSLEEILDVKNNIDAERYPERFKLLEEALQRKSREQLSERAEQDASSDVPVYMNDKVAKSINWSPLSSTRFSFKSKKLVKINPNRIEFVPSTQLKLFYSFLVLIGLLLIASTFVFDFNFSNNEKVGVAIFTIMLGLFVLFITSFTWGAYSTPVIFDKSLGVCWKSKLPLANIKNKRLLELYLELKDVYALQILNQLVNHDEENYNCYEINLVTKYSKRVNIISHGSKTILLEQAQVLSKFLDKPIWNRVEVEFDWNSKFKLGLE